MESFIKDITFEYFQKTKIGSALQQAISIIEKIQETAYAYVNDDEPDIYKNIKIGTIIILSILSKIVKGKGIKDFSKEDWKDIVYDTADYAVILDGQVYSVMIFTLYANYIDSSVLILEKRGISKDKCDAIKALSGESRYLNDMLKAGSISEVDYTEKCLWIMLEAMIKLLASYSTIWIGEDASVFVQGVSMLAFEYARYTLYKQELELLDMYMKQQCALDAEMQERFSTFMAKMEERISEFNSFIKDAFCPDISLRLKSSVSVAKQVGVHESEILNSIERIDDYFL